MLKKYRVTVTRDVTESAIIEVEALTPQSASERAILIARGCLEPGQWTRDDCSGSEPYLPDGNNSAEEVDEAGEAAEPVLPEAEGRAFLLRIPDRASGDGFITVAGLKESWSRFFRGASFLQASANVRGAGTFTSEAAESAVRSMALSGAPEETKLVFSDGETIKGKFRVAEMVYAGLFDGNRQFHVTLESAGPVVRA